MFVHVDQNKYELISGLDQPSPILRDFLRKSYANHQAENRYKGDSSTERTRATPSKKIFSPILLIFGGEVPLDERIALTNFFCSWTHILGFTGVQNFQNFQNFEVRIYFSWPYLLIQSCYHYNFGTK